MRPLPACLLAVVSLLSACGDVPGPPPPSAAYGVVPEIGEAAREFPELPRQRRVVLVFTRGSW
ncbi:MAG: hypothetical protein ACYTG6_11720 [Planctomycetota bacterium]